MQGDYLALIMEERDCVTWKSYLWDVPQGVLKFAINAGINTLPTFDNLKRGVRGSMIGARFAGMSKRSRTFCQTVVLLLSRVGLPGATIPF